MESIGGIPNGSKNMSEQNSTGFENVKCDQNIFFFAYEKYVDNFSEYYTLDSDIQIGEVCCFSMISVNLEYQMASLDPWSRLIEAVKMWFQDLSNFWHCSNNFREGMCIFLKT